MKQRLACFGATLVASALLAFGCDESTDPAADAQDTLEDTLADAGDTGTAANTVALPAPAGRIPASLERGHACSVRTDAGAGGDATWLPTLAASGCYDIEGSVATPSAGALPYRVRVPLWSDLADKERFLYLPAEGTITYAAQRSFELPEGTVILKEFWFGGRLVESRFSQLQDGVWVAATYAWDDEGEDAELVEQGREVQLGDTTWFLPGIEDCTLCHTRAAGFVLGLRGDQLFLDVDIFDLGEVNQLSAYSALGLFDEPLPDTLELTPLSPLDDAGASNEHRVRSYFASNCANCHQPGGAPHSDIDLRITTDLGASRACDVYPTSGDLGLRADARIIAPGDPESSVLALRMALRDDEAMPQLGTFLVHDEAVDAVREWILGLQDCD